MMSNNNFRTPARETTIHPGAQIQSGVYIGPGCQISAEAVISLHAQLEGEVTLIGQVKIGRAVKINTGCSLVGPLEIEAETTLGTGVVIGARIAPLAPRPLHTLIRHTSHIGSQAVILAGLTLGEGSFVNAHSVLTGDLPAHCLAEGDPAALRGFICPCGGMTEIRFDHRSAVEITYLCMVCRQPVTVPAALGPNINHVLLPGPRGGKFGELVHFPDWKQPRWNEG
jgi:UDP-2-acetamido-3-amino-2,3-dideoxy-glucuronate N-acetyltransferase